ncbi:MAG: hypothetical protein AMXMBFR84_37280 [Candidatus Hydrogenedentota bacterium]
MSLKDRIRRGEPIPFPIAFALAALTPITRMAMQRRLREPRVKLAARVISFGNLTAGGSGKTPAVIERVRQEMAAGRRVAVLTRGYGAENARPAMVNTAEVSEVLARHLGDEPALIARKARGVIIGKNADRVAAGREAIEKHGCDTLILDDGYQYVRLERDENVLVIDAANPFGSGHLLPRGVLREPLEAMDRATHIVLTRCDQAPGLRELTEKIRKQCPGIPIRYTRHAPKHLVNAADGRIEPLNLLRGLPVAVACGIGHPEAFVKTLASLGAILKETRFAPDHASFRLPDVAGSRYIVITEKDMVRLHNPPKHVWALAVELEDMPAGY